MNRRTFLQATAITIGLPAMPIMAKQKPRWIPLVVRTLPKVGQRIVIVVFSFKKETTIHIGKVLTTNHMPPSGWEPRISLKEEMRYQNCDGSGLFPKGGYALWYKRNLPYDAIELSKKKMKCLKTTVWWGGEEKFGTVYVWNYRNKELSFGWWAPIDQIPDVLPPFPGKSQWIPFSEHTPKEGSKIAVKDKYGEAKEGMVLEYLRSQHNQKILCLMSKATKNGVRYKYDWIDVSKNKWHWRYVS